MINYIEKGYGLWAAIRNAGHELNAVDGKYTSDNDVAVQAIIDAYDPAAYDKAQAAAAAKDAALAQIKQTAKSIDSIDTASLIAELWLAIPNPPVPSPAMANLLAACATLKLATASDVAIGK